MTQNLATLDFAERRQIVRLLVEEVLVNTATEEITVRHILPMDPKFPLRKGSKPTPLRSPSGWMQDLPLRVQNARFEPLPNQP